MEFGIVLQTNPPAARTVELARQAETHGFDYVWTFDSPLLWQEPFVIYSAILAATRKVTVGPMVTNPATRDWTVIASLFATLNEMYGNRTVCGIGRGDSAVRAINGRPSSLATTREAIHVIRELANDSVVEVNGAKVRFRGARGQPLRCGSPGTGPWPSSLPARWATASSCSLPTPTSRRGRSQWSGMPPRRQAATPTP